MKKTLIAAAVMAASGVAFAASNVTLYGVIETGVVFYILFFIKKCCFCVNTTDFVACMSRFYQNDGADKFLLGI